MTERMRKAALGQEKADLVLKNGRVLNVFTKEFYTADVAVCDGVIVGVGSYDGERNVDVTGKTITPGFMDAHLHIESSMVTPVPFASEVVLHGTTGLIIDPHEVANVRGKEAVWFFLEQAAKAPCRIYVMLPSCVPATPFEDNGAALTVRELTELMQEEYVLGLGEMMDFGGVLQGEAQVCAKLDAFVQRPIDGHAPLLTGKELQTYRLAGVDTDHECSQEQEVLDKLRCGMYLHVREGSAAHNLDAIIRAVQENGLPFDRLCVCTDDRHIHDIRQEGHIDHILRRLLALGVPEADAYCMATFNIAQCYGLKKQGAIAPGYRADLVVLDDARQVRVAAVYRGGIQVTPDQLRDSLPSEEIPTALRRTVSLGAYSADSLRLACTDEPQDIIEIVPGQLLTRRVSAVLPQRDGVFVPDTQMNKIAVLERHHATGSCGVGAIIGFSVDGAIATTVAHDSHNLTVVGSNDADMLTAIRELERCQGGYTLVQHGQVLATLPLPICGLLTGEKNAVVDEQLQKMLTISRQMGVPESFEPFITLSFLSLPVIPEIRITNRGILLFREL